MRPGSSGPKITCEDQAGIRMYRSENLTIKRTDVINRNADIYFKILQGELSNHHHDEVRS